MVEDLSQYLEEFLADARERIDNLNNAVLQLEEIAKRGADEGEKRRIIDQIFREAHTLKGTAATMGFTELSEVAHKMENLFDDIREGRIDISNDIVDIVFEFLDVISEMINDIEKGREHKIDLKSLYEKVDKIKEKVALEPSSKTKQENNLGEVRKYSVKVFFDKNNTMRGVRAFLILSDLEEIGEVIETIPERKKIEEGKLEGDSVEYIVLSHKTPDEIKSMIKKHPEVLGVKINEALEAGVKRIEIYLQKEAPLKEARSFLIMQDLERIGEIVDIKPKKSEIEAGKLIDGNRFIVYLKTQEDEETIKEIITKHPDVEKVELEKKEEKRQEEPNIQKFADRIKISKLVRINVEHLDKLMDLVSELVINKGRLEQIAESLESKELLEALSTTSRLMSELQEEIMTMRLISLSEIFNKFPRMVRDLSKEMGKEVKLIMEGQDIEVDRAILDKLSDILVHLLRNAVDHGIEPPEEREKLGKPRVGTIKLIAKREKDRIEIVVMDDGRGIDPAKIKEKAILRGLLTESAANSMSTEELLNLIFMPGFSTAERVSSVSGRGVGLDVVQEIVKSLNGSLSVRTEVGKGTSFIIRLPISTAIIQALLIQVADEIYAVPINNILESKEIVRDEIRTIGKKEVIVLRGEIIPLYMLHKLIGLSQNNKDRFPAIIVDLGSQKIAIGVDELLHKKDIVIKPLGKLLSHVSGFSGATILGDGRVVLIIDINSLLEGAKYGGV